MNFGCSCLSSQHFRELVKQGYGNVGDKAEPATGWRALIFAGGVERRTRAVEYEAT